MSSKANPRKELSKSASAALGEVLHSQPGAELGEGTFWQAVNCVTYMTDHLIGRNPDTRLQSAWYGTNRSLKLNAFEVAMEMATAA
jgi:hypothetical protein